MVSTELSAVLDDRTFPPISDVEIREESPAIDDWSLVRHERLMLAGRLDGVSADDDVARATLGAIRSFARDRSVVYLPTHDPASAERLSSCRLVSGDSD